MPSLQGAAIGEPMTTPDTKREMLRHTVATLAYRIESCARCERSVCVIQSVRNHAHAGPDSGTHRRPARLGVIDRQRRRNLEQLRAARMVERDRTISRGAAVVRRLSGF